MAVVINIKRGDTKGKFVDTLTLNSVAVDLTNCAIKFLMRRRGKPALSIAQDADITNPPGTDGDVEYQPVPADVAEEGVYEQEWEVTFVSGEVLTFPNDGFNTVNILRDLGGVAP